MSSLDEIRRALSLLIAPGQIFEIRALGSKRTYSGYFDNIEKAATQAAKINGKAQVYFTPNPCDKALLARAANRIEEQPKVTTTDHDIAGYAWFLIDLDAVRPAGISATDAEHEAALCRAREVQAFLSNRGWPDPVAGDSGNGAHLMYRIRLPNSPESRDLIKRCLAALALYFTDEQIAVDESVFNPARIWKLYGTLACKGDSIPDRPHRLSKVLSAPSELGEVTRAQLEELATLLPPEPTHESRSYHRGEFNLEGWIAERGLSVKGPFPWGKGQKWIFTECPWGGQHMGSKPAFILQFADGAIAAGCLDYACRGHDWHALRDLVEPGWRDRKKSKAKGEDAAPPEDGWQWQEEAKAEWAKPSLPEGMDASTLWGMNHPDPKWAVPSLIPEGVTILAGRPKAKKSWFMLGTALAVASGGVALGSIKVAQGDVLYLALEDTKRRLTRRLRDISPEEAPPAGRLTFYTEWPRLHQGGVELIKRWLSEHPEARLVIIDTLAKVRPQNAKTGNAYTDDYIVGDLLTEISKQCGIAIVVITHVRKMEAEEPVDLINATLGLSGGVDGYMVLRKEPGAADAFLYVNGRDIEEEGNYALEWHVQTCTWHLKEGEAHIYKLSPERRRIIDLLNEHGPLFTKEVAEHLNPGIEIKDSKTSKEYRKAQFLLYKLRDDGYIQFRPYDKRWEVCANPTGASGASAGASGPGEHEDPCQTRAAEKVRVVRVVQAQKCKNSQALLPPKEACKKFTSTTRTANTTRTASTARTCPKCDGEGCEYCGGMGRLVEDEIEESGT